MALTTTQVSQLYVALFGRASEGEGNKNWVNHDKNMIDTAALMLNSDPAKNYFGEAGKTNYGFVEVIYKNTLGFDNAADIAAWAANLDNGMSRAELVTLLLEEALSSKYAGSAPQNQLINRIDVSDYMANNVETVAAENVASTQFQSLVHPNGKLVVTDDKSTVSSAESAIDEMSGGTVIDGKTFSLTADSDKNIILTAKNDLVEAGKFLDGKTILDQGGNDTLNATLTAALTNATTIQGVEKINLDWDSYSDATVDAANITAEKGKTNTITLTSSKAGFLGNATVTNAGENNITAGTGIKGTLTVDEVAKSIINATAAAKVVIDGTNETDDEVTINSGATTTDITVGNTKDIETVTITAGEVSKNITVAGYDNATIDAKGSTKVDLTDNGSSSKTTLNLTNDATLVLNASAGIFDVTVAEGKTVTATGTTYKELNILGSGDSVLKANVNGEKIINKKADGKLTIETSETGLVDMSKVQADLVKFTANVNNTITAKTGANIELAAVDTTAVIATSAAKNETINVKASAASVTSLTAAATLENLVLTAAATEKTGTDLTIATLVLNSNNVIINGKNDVVISATTINTKGSVNASELDGDFTLTQTPSATEFSVVGAKGKNIINFGTIASAAKVSTVLSGTENTVAANVKDLTTGHLIVNAASGTNTIDLSSTAAAAGTDATIVLELGSGKDTLKLSGQDFSVANIVATGLDVVDIATAATVAASFVNGKSYEVISGAANAVLNVKATDATGETIDLSGLKLTQLANKNVEKVEITGLAGNDTIKGTSQINIIKGGNGKDTIDISASQSVSDKIVLDGILAAANGDTIKGFVTGSIAAADKVHYTATSATTNTVVFQDVASKPTANVTFTTVSSSFLEFSFDLGSKTTLGADGTALLAALGHNINVSSDGDKGYIIAYNQGNAYLYHAAESVDADQVLAASDIALVGVFENVTVGSFVAGNFDIA